MQYLPEVQPGHLPALVGQVSSTSINKGKPPSSRDIIISPKPMQFLKSNAVWVHIQKSTEATYICLTKEKKKKKKNQKDTHISTSQDKKRNTASLTEDSMGFFLMTALLFVPGGDHHAGSCDHISLTLSMVLALMYATLNNKFCFPYLRFI